jgi:hypothetical protein
MFGNGEYSVESQNAMPALTVSTSFVDGDGAGRPCSHLRARYAIFSPEEKNRKRPGRLRARREPSAQATFSGSEGDDRGKVANVPAPRPVTGAAAREQILAHLAKFDTE